MAKRLLLLLAVLALVGVIGGPWLYRQYLEGDPDPRPALPTERHAATTGINGRWMVAPNSGATGGRSLAGYRADQKLLWQTVTVDGRTDAVRGEAVVDGTMLESATFTVDVASMHSSHHGRDGKFLSSDVMDAAKFPTARLTVSEPVDLSGLAADGAPMSIEMAADLTLKGVTHREALQADIQRSEGRVFVAGRTSVAFADYKINPPAPFAGLLAVQPIATVEFLVELVKK